MAQAGHYDQNGCLCAGEIDIERKAADVCSARRENPDRAGGSDRLPLEIILNQAGSDGAKASERS